MWGKLHSLCPVVSVSSLLRHNVFKVNSWFSIDQNCNLLRLNNISLCVPPRFVYPAVSGHLGYVHHLFTVMSNVPINIGAYSRFAHRSDFDMYIWKWTSWTVRLNVDSAFLWRLSVVWPWAGDCFFLCITGNKNSVRHPLLYGQGCYTTQVKIIDCPRAVPKLECPESVCPVWPLSVASGLCRTVATDLPLPAHSGPYFREQIVFLESCVQFYFQAHYSRNPAVVPSGKARLCWRRK